MDSLKKQACVDVSPEFHASLLSKNALARQPCAIRNLFVHEAEPGILSLLAGKPNPSTFPFTKMSINLKSPYGGSNEELVISDPEDVAEMFNYTPTTGLPRLLQLFEDLQALVHGRRRDASDPGWKLSIGSGSQDLLNKAFDSLINPGDPILVETPVYSGVIPLFHAYGANVIEVHSDAHGTSSEHLRKIMAEWQGERRPRIMYTIPNGSNPLGTTTTLPRKLEILKIARESGILLVEDDPYAFLYYGQEAQPPSYFALESETGLRGHVLRFDSVSKFLSSGLRIGFVSGPNTIVDAINMHSSSSTLQPNSTAQAIVQALFLQWGLEGVMAQAAKTAIFYRTKRDTFEAAAHRHLTGVATWNTPTAGMFLWLQLINVKDTSTLLAQAISKGVLVTPGHAFYTAPTISNCVRVSFSMIPDDRMDEALSRLRLAIEACEARG